MTETGILSDTVFYLFATVIVAGALSVVTIRSPKGAVFAFSVFCLCLGGLFYALAMTTIAVAQSIIGVVALIVYQIKFGRAGERADDRVSMLASPNQTVAVFLLLCFFIAMTPVWIYSIWSPQAGEAPASPDMALLTQLSGQYLPTVVGVLLALSIVALFAFHLRQLKVTATSDSKTVVEDL